MFSLGAFLLLTAFLSIQNTDAGAETKGTKSTVNLRVEANSTTLWEGLIKSGPRYINVSEGPYPTYPCDGTLDNPNPQPGAPGNTALDALDEASKLAHFTYDGEYFEEDEDYAITRIGTDGGGLAGNGRDYFWGSFVNYQVSPMADRINLAACHDILKNGDEVLWAYLNEVWPVEDDNAKSVSLLKLSPTAVTVKKGQGIAVTVIDGRTGNNTKGASVAGVKTDSQGKATLYFSKPGFYQFKAHRTGDVRSNRMNVTVTN